MKWTLKKDLFFWSALVFVLQSGCQRSSMSPPPMPKDPLIESLNGRFWVGLGPGGTKIVRVLSDQLRCVHLSINQAVFATHLKASANASFPLHVCEFVIQPTLEHMLKKDHPQQKIRLTVGQKTMEWDPNPPKKIVILGDTGCRISTHGILNDVQNCLDPNQWPFQKNIQQALSFKPNLVIHTGDYNYRESQCPSNEPGCQGSPWGDQLVTWKADFLDPAQALLEEAPWLFVRGNHESCARSHQGWFRFFDTTVSESFLNTSSQKTAQTASQSAIHEIEAQAGEVENPQVSCIDHTDPFSVDLGNFKVAVLDSSKLDEAIGNRSDTEVITHQLLALQKKDPDVDGLITHKPFWGISVYGKEIIKKLAGLKNIRPLTEIERGLPIAVNKNLQHAISKVRFNNLHWTLSGHIHALEALFFKSSSMVQWTVGNGGSSVHEIPTKEQAKKLVYEKAGQKFPLIDIYASNQFGFLLMELEEGKTPPSPTKQKVQPTANAQLSYLMTFYNLQSKPLKQWRWFPKRQLFQSL